MRSISFCGGLEMLLDGGIDANMLTPHPQAARIQSEPTVVLLTEDFRIAAPDHAAAGGDS